jgi:tetratricopeptide (TPR) repeat protein
MAKQMQPFHFQGRIIVASILAALLAVAGGLWWLCTHSNGIAFLPSKPGAEWIVYPRSPDTVIHRAVPLIALFRHTFTLDTLPARATLAVRACKSAVVVINGQTLTHLELAGQNWKSVSTADVTGLLRAGTNQISVCVTNSLGPPALWLRLETDARFQGTDGCWQASLVNGVWQKARPASQPLSILPDDMHYGGEQTMDSVKRVWPVIAAFCAIAAILVLSVSHLLQRQNKLVAAPATASSAKLIYGLFIIVVITWMALSINNLPQLPRPMGFDAEPHEQYIQFIQQKHALPLPRDGFEMYQPPLYYAGNALLLEVCGLWVPDDDATFVLRSVNGVIGLIHCWLALLCFRLLFPKNLSAQAAGLLVAAFLPPHLYLSQYVTNETLAGLFITVAFYFCLRVLRAERVSLWLHAGIGAALGAAMLTKFSSLLAIPVFLAALGLRLLLRKERVYGDGFRSLGVVLLSCLVVCGWHYGRIWAHTGRLIVGNWEADSGFSWWQQPGFQTSAYYFRFGQALVSPLFSTFHSFGDGIYSTFWGDGSVSGVKSLVFRPPWNYDLMNAGYLLAIGISLLLFVGFVVVLVRFIRQPTPEWLIVLGLPLVFFLGIVYMSLVAPYSSVVKAFYAFPALVPFSALVAVGWDWLGQKHRVVQTTLWVVLLVWVMTVYAAFWIRSSNPETWRLRGFFQQAQGNYAEAIESFSQALRLKPDDAVAHYFLAAVLVRQNREEEAVGHYREALRVRPDFPEALNFLAVLLATGPDANIRDGPEAVRLAERACELTHYQQAAMVSTLAAAYAEAGRFDEAIATAQRACDLAAASGDQGLLELNRRMLQFYRAHKP